MNSLWDIRIFLGLVPKESPCSFSTATVVTRTRLIVALYVHWLSYYFLSNAVLISFSVYLFVKTVAMKIRLFFITSLLYKFPEYENS
jgi:hypothetical protein